MLHIITEDSNSARDFWECVAHTFKRADEYRMVPLESGGGNRTIEGQFKSILPGIQKGDNILIVIDNIAGAINNSLSVYMLIKELRNKCKELGVGLRVTSYHCFEDLYLSYEEISNMYKACKNADKVIIDVLD